jgi:hypothetical protein
MDFISRHLIVKINKMVNEKQDSINFNGFFHFNDGIKEKSGTINRVNRNNPFYKEEILPTNYHILDGKSIFNIYNKIKNNDFFFYKSVNGIDHKLSFKNVIK